MGAVVGRSRKHSFKGMLVIAVTWALMAASPASAEVTPYEVREYSKDVKVPAGQAEEVLQTQSDAAGGEVVAGVEQRLGDGYAGIWFDNVTGEFVVPVLPGESRQAVAGEMAGAGLQGDFRTVAVDDTWEDLEAAQDRIDVALEEQLDQGLVQTALDPRANAVVITQVSGAGAAEHRQVSDLAASAGVDVKVAQTGRESLAVEPQACSFPRLLCDQPLRGGVAIQEAGTPLSHNGCSAGFKATAPNGDRYVLTAGHCVEIEKINEWGSFTSTGAAEYLGKVAGASFPEHDWASIGVNGSYWDTSPWPSQVVHWGHVTEQNAVTPPVNANNSITGEASSYVGQYVCHTGQTTGSSCGLVSGIGITKTTDKGSVVNYTEFGPICSKGGDSGGPVFAGNIALGLYSADQLPQNTWEFCKATGYYTEITEATAALGVSVGPKVDKYPPSVETKTATAIGETQAILNGTVNPMGQETTYLFEYGPTTSYGSSIPVPEGSAGSGSQAVAKSAIVDGLTPGVTYHYRIVAKNASGVSNGDDHQFTTLQPRPATVVDASGATHVFYRSQNNQLREYYQYGSTWKHKEWGNANAMAGNPTAILGSDGKIWVYFKTPTGQLGTWWFQGSNWNYEALGNTNTVAGNPTAILGSDGKIWVYFKTPTGQLGTWWFQGSSWNYAAFGADDTVAGDPTAFQASDGKRWVYFRTPSGQLGTWWFEGTNWNYAAFGADDTVAGDPTAFQASDGKRWVYFRTPSGQLGTWWFEGTNWNYAAVGAGDTVAGDPTAFQADGKRWVYIKTPSGQLGAWWFQETNWNYEGVGYTGALGGDPSAIVGSTGKREVLYFDPNGRPHRWWFSGSDWNLEDISVPPVAFVPTASEVVDASGATHVFYRSQNNQLREYYQYGSTWKHKEWGNANAMAGNPTAILGSDGKIWVYFKTPTGQLGTWWFQGSNWNYEALGAAGTVAGDPTALQASDGKRWVYFRTPSGQLGTWWFDGSNWNYEGIGYTGAIAGDPTAFQASDGKRWVYLRTPSGQLASWWFQGANSSYEGIGYTGAIAGDPTAFQASDGKRWVYLRTPSGQLGAWWFQGTNLSYEALGAAGTVAGDPTALQASDGKRWVYFRTPSGQLGTWWFDGSNWNYEGIGYTGALSGDPSAIVGSAGRREVFYFDPEAFAFRWWFLGSNWNLEGLVY